MVDPGEMGILEHLGELRRRIAISLLGIVIAAIGLYYFSGEIFAFLAVPYRETFGSADLIGTGPAEAFLLKLKMAALLGVIVASPLIFYQVWLFVEPGLLQEEKKLAVPFVLSTTALFLTGVCFCLYVVFPFAYEFFAKQYASIAVTPTIKIQEHLSFVGRGVLAFGVVFELPILAFFLARLGLISSQMLVSGFRYALVGIFALSAVITPPDVITQFLMAAPLCLLYWLSVFIVRTVERRRP